MLLSLDSVRYLMCPLVTLFAEIHSCQLINKYNCLQMTFIHNHMHCEKDIFVTHIATLIMIFFKIPPSDIHIVHIVCVCVSHWFLTLFNPVRLQYNNRKVLHLDICWRD